MFYGQCDICGERWELGRASTCKCPPLPDYRFNTKDALPVAQKATLSLSNIKPNYNMQFHKSGKQIGILDWNGPQMTFTGDMEESAKVFFDWVAQSFASRLEQERKAARAVAEPHKWVGLTDEEIRKEFNPLHDTGLQFARAIEAKLREKNGMGEKK